MKNRQLRALSKLKPVYYDNDDDIELSKNCFINEEILFQVTPEGHRAPLAELFRRSVNTQTPHDLCHTAHSSGKTLYYSIGNKITSVLKIMITYTPLSEICLETVITYKV